MDDLWRRKGWEGLSLARQFALAGGVVMLAATLLVGWFVSGRIEEVVVRNTANATALYMESFVAPLTQDLARSERLTEASRRSIGALLAGTALGRRVVSFKIWRTGGLLVDASNTALVGHTFPPTENLKLAWSGEVRADFEDTGDPEDAHENALGVPLLEIYSPIRDIETGRVIAVAEFYEVATQLKTDLARARLASWATVALVMLAIAASLFAVVLRGSRTIDSQLAALSDMSARNVALRLRVQGAAARFAAMNDQTLRRIGADLHDGPAQLLGFAALRLDALRKAAGPEAGPAVDEVARAVKDAIAEVRTISRGVSLPDVDRRSLADLVQGLADAHKARTGTEVQVDAHVAPGVDLPDAVKICVYRFVQEGLNNGWRHAGGKEQEVRLQVTADELRLAVADRGPGFAAPPPGAGADGTTLGLAGLADRVESLGGQFMALNRAGGGAELAMTLDLRGV
ncbi:sensor histidine kinase [Tabrizicola oligotrophica]|uniref:Two-component sensor histidine kinase n=1 Tax=Tabrizicola oligotrophica TaxID=2710650 RepID=A0A6M0QTP4_9RHOB|nr:histidine kinase [Tabrizicola oligotrophica]NEY90371.1 two-component sensor histidine kinase [Tabrizicola oligotrophica]